MPRPDPHPHQHHPLALDHLVTLTLVLRDTEVALEGVRSAMGVLGVAEVAWNPRSKRLKVRGARDQMEAAFGFRWVALEGLGPCALGEAILPESLAPHVRGCLGVDPRPLLRPHLKAKAFAASAAPEGVGHLATAFAQRYGFPQGDGKGVHVGLLQLGGRFDPSDLKTYFEALGLPVPEIQVIPVSGGDPKPTKDSRWEMTLDLEVLGALVPAAKISLFVAPNNAEGLLDLVEAALAGGADQPSVLSMSWGAPESEWGALELELVSDAFKAAVDLGVTVLVSSGDEGSTGGVTDGKQHVAFPASCPWVLGVGGTMQAGNTEVVWNALEEQKGATGGGVSDFFELPEWQKAAGVPASVNDGVVRRGVPDLAAHAAEEGGYRIFVDGQWRVLGGTSAAAPLLAGLIARINATREKPLGYLNPALYGSAWNALRPIHQGTNPAYSASSGYSACTGLGVVDGAALMRALGN